MKTREGLSEMNHYSHENCCYMLNATRKIVLVKCKIDKIGLTIEAYVNSPAQLLKWENLKLQNLLR